jgi:hypothetical protein
MNERRQEPRYKSLKRARIHVEGAPSGKACVVRGRSVNGARIQIEQAMPPGQSIHIYFLTEHVSNPARVVCQQAQDVGIAFVRPLPWFGKHSSA